MASAPVASAAPRNSAAKADFERGVRLYQAGKFAEAALAFKASYDIEIDTETVFALAQSNRQMGKCKAAITYYDLLLGERSLPAANRSAIVAAKKECVDILAEANGGNGGSDAPPDPTDGSGSGSAPPEVDTPPGDAHHWYKDPAGDLLAGGGIAATIAGALFLSAANSDHTKLATIHDEAAYDATKSRAQTEYDVSIGCFIGGGVLLVSGVSWYLSHTGEDPPKHKHHAATMTGWVRGNGGGLSVLGEF